MTKRFEPRIQEHQYASTFVTELLKRQPRVAHVSYGSKKIKEGTSWHVGFVDAYEGIPVGSGGIHVYNSSVDDGPYIRNSNLLRAAFKHLGTELAKGKIVESPRGLLYQIFDLDGGLEGWSISGGFAEWLKVRHSPAYSEEKRTRSGKIGKQMYAILQIGMQNWVIKGNKKKGYVQKTIGNLDEFDDLSLEDRIVLGNL